MLRITIRDELIAAIRVISYHPCIFVLLVTEVNIRGISYLKRRFGVLLTKVRGISYQDSGYYLLVMNYRSVFNFYYQHDKYFLESRNT